MAFLHKRLAYGGQLSCLRNIFRDLLHLMIDGMPRIFQCLPSFAYPSIKFLLHQHNVSIRSFIRLSQIDLHHTRLSQPMASTFPMLVANEAN
jgi:DNA-directed RNA polymerase